MGRNVSIIYQALLDLMCKFFPTVSFCTIIRVEHLVCQSVCQSVSMLMWTSKAYCPSEKFSLHYLQQPTKLWWSSNLKQSVNSNPNQMFATSTLSYHPLKCLAPTPPPPKTTTGYPLPSPSNSHALGGDTVYTSTLACLCYDFISQPHLFPISFDEN